MVTKKSGMKWSDYIPLALFVLFFGVLVGYPVVRDKYFPVVPTHVVEWKEKVVEKERIVEKEVAPTLTINSLKLMVTEVLDGSHLKATIELPLGVHLVDQTIECVGYETYGLNELKGLDAKNELVALLDGDAQCYGMTTDQIRDDEGNILLAVYVRQNDAVIPIAQRLTEKDFVKEVVQP